ncbi:MAG: cytochrome-c peroxidase, partial [Flavobacteriales bacterium]|nr:cytochrome-c peroxidase [Flavobacteriales bacterium]
LLDSQGAPVRMNLTETEKGALKAFMETLTDIPMLNDEKFSDPFE